MPVTINGDGSITGLSVGGLPDGCVDTDTLANGAATGAKQGTGSVIQVVQGVLSSGASHGSSSYGDLGLSASITPQTNSKVLCLVSIHASLDYKTNRGYGIKLLRDSSTVYEDPIDYAIQGNTNSTVGDGRVRADWQPLDSSPGGNGSTSLTYKIQVRTHGGRTVSFNEGSTTSSLTLLEIKG
jgi:hypothetical protein|tara:strand:- start:33 stop:581 length:549 start_codon:yes stop_codon:yes gene_type:complete